MNKLFVKQIYAIFGPTVIIEHIFSKTHSCLAKITHYGSSDVYSFNPASNELVYIPPYLVNVLLNPKN